jgi:hypothetical protein
MTATRIQSTDREWMEATARGTTVYEVALAGPARRASEGRVWHNAVAIHPQPAPLQMVAAARWVNLPAVDSVVLECWDLSQLFDF